MGDNAFFQVPDNNYYQRNAAQIHGSPYQNALALIGREVRNKRTGTKATVKDVVPQKDNTVLVWLSNGAIPPLDEFWKKWEPAQ